MTMDNHSVPGMVLDMGLSVYSTDTCRTESVREQAAAE